MTSKETLKLVAKGGLLLLCALIVIMASAGALNYGVQPGNFIYIIAGLLNFCVSGYVLYYLYKKSE
jgi:hypothetical protein